MFLWKNDIESNLCIPSQYSRSDFLHWCEATVYIRCIQVFKGVKKNCTWACGSFGKIILIQNFCIECEATLYSRFDLGIDIHTHLKWKQHNTVAATKFSKELWKKLEQSFKRLQLDDQKLLITKQSLNQPIFIFPSNYHENWLWCFIAWLHHNLYFQFSCLISFKLILSFMLLK